MNSNLIDKMKLNLDNSLVNKKKTINNQSSLEEVAQEFESLYVFQMLKSARAAKLSDELLGNSATDTYYSMMDNELAMKLSKSGNFGIAEALIRQFGHVEKDKDE